MDIGVHPHHSLSSPLRSSGSSDQASNSSGWERFLPPHPLRVLLVEEDVATRQIVSALLSKCGYEVSPAADSIIAWNLLENPASKFDLILADAFLPVISGTDLLTKIMSHDSHKDIPVIMMSSQDSLDVVFQCLLRGAKDFLVKPVRKNELQNLWQHVWRKNRESSRSAHGGCVQGKKRKATRMSSSADVSSDGFSISGGLSAQNDHPNGHAAQVVNSESHQLQRDEDPSRGGAINNQEALDCEVGSQTLLEQRDNPLSNVDYAGGPERSTKAVDSIGTITEHLISNGRRLRVENEVSLARLYESLPEREIALRTFSKEHQLANNSGKQSVQQSHCSAFSKYVVSCTTEKSVMRSVSLPSDGNSYANGNTVDGHAGASTLHFPQAIHFRHAGQQRTSALASLASSNAENLRHSVQETFRSPSLNSTTNIPSPSNPNAPSNGSENGECGTGDAQSMVQHKVHHHYHRLIKTDHIGSNQQNAHQPSPAADCVSNVERNATSHEMPGYLMASSGGSNFCEEHHMGRSVNYTGSGSCGPFCAGADESSVVECSKPTNEEVEQLKANDYRIAIRQAALNKFRQKRKVRCFEKKVRYQTRKKLAEQRPRVKGQFVRQAVYDAVAAVKPDRQH